MLVLGEKLKNAPNIYKHEKIQEAASDAKVEAKSDVKSKLVKFAPS